MSLAKEDSDVYTILKTLNNNVAQVKDENGKQLIIFGKGLAYGKKEGDVISDKLVIESYFLTKQDSAYFSDIVGNISSSIINVAEMIIEEARKTLKGKYNANLLLMISDHLNFALQRYEDGIIIGSPLEYEIKRLYQEEVKVGTKALEIIKRELDID
ncbi:MAG: CAT RNA binding domain-containing protein, partial [Longicatena sp.]